MDTKTTPAPGGDKPVSEKKRPAPPEHTTQGSNSKKQRVVTIAALQSLVASLEEEKAEKSASSWVEVAGTIMKKAVDQHKMFLYMAVNICGQLQSLHTDIKNMEERIRTIWMDVHGLSKDSPWIDAKAATQAMIDANKDDREGVRIIKRGLTESDCRIKTRQKIFLPNPFTDA